MTDLRDILRTAVRGQGALNDVISQLKDIEKKYGYFIALGEQLPAGSFDDASHVYVGFVVAQTRNSGDFSKWSKVVKATSNTGLPLAVYPEFDAAKEHWNALPANIRDNYRIFPVLMQAGGHPVTKDPIPV